MMPSYCSMLLKTSKDEVIELKAMYTYDYAEGDKLGWAYFPITEDQIKTIIEDGVLKFRIQIIADQDHHSTFADKEWSKDYLGFYMKGMYSSLESTWKKQKSKYLADKEKTQKGFHEGF